MKIQYASDLHLEFAENKSFVEHGGTEGRDELVFDAGDVGVKDSLGFIAKGFQGVGAQCAPGGVVALRYGGGL